MEVHKFKATAYGASLFYSPQNFESTGAGRGMGVYIAKAALATGHKVVATGRARQGT